MAYASGKFARALCDRCSFEYKLHELKEEWTGFKVCSSCYEPKHPQLDPIRVGPDPQALRNPKPRVEFINAKVEFPIFDLQTISFKEKLKLESALGTVTVSTS